MIFGWQGFSLEHPDDWAPVHLSGTRNEGYVRIASPGRVACQLRWRSAPIVDDLADRLSIYLARLEKDAKKAKASFNADIEYVEGRYVYKYSGHTFGKGAIFNLDGRVFFLELISTKNDSMLSLYRQIADSFCNGDVDRWTLLGLDVRLPKGLKVERTVLEAGHTALNLTGRGVGVRAERWGFGEQLVAKHGLAEWAKEVLHLKKARVIEECSGVRLESSGLRRTTALVARQADRNQLAILSVSTRKKGWRPEWDWIV